MTETLPPSIADRQLHLSGAVNFRDLGGYLTMKAGLNRTMLLALQIGLLQ
jgi:hypothetical protein